MEPIVILLIFMFSVVGVFVGYTWGAADSRAVLEEYKQKAKEMDENE